MKLRKGDLLIGHHDLRLGKQLGSGTSGVTYVATVHRPALGQVSVKKGDKVVIKTPQVGSGLTNDEIKERLKDLFERGLVEARAEQFLKGLHCVAQVIEYDDYRKVSNEREKMLAVVQQYVDGVPLNQYLDGKYARGRKGGFRGLPTEEAFFQWATSIVSVVRQVHQRQVVHGDIWQENVLVRKGTLEPVLIDFGQAAFISKGLGQVSSRGGTFMAPEGNTTISSDIYSLGWLLLYLATGEEIDKKTGKIVRPPEILRHIGHIERLKTGVVERMRKRNRGLYDENCGIADIISRCLRKSSKRRTRNAAALLRDIVLFDAGAPVIHGTGALVKQIRRLDSKSSLISALIGGTIMNLTDQLADLRLGVLDLHDDFVVGLTQVVSLLSRGNQYITVSTPRFWYDHNLGIQGRFLSANRQAVLRHGATIRRLFLITKGDLKDDPFLDSIVEAQLEIQRELQREIARGSKTVGRCDLYFQTVTEKKRLQMVREGMNFGVLIKGKQRLLLSIGYDDKDFIGRIQFRSDPILTKKYVANFDELVGSKDTKPLSEFHEHRQERGIPSKRPGRRGDSR